jgi:HlyD family secretion protein
VIDSIQNAYTVSDSVVKNTVDQFIDSPQTDPKLSFFISSQQYKNTVEVERAAIGLKLAMWMQSEAAYVSQGDLQSAETLAAENLQSVAQLLTDSNIALSNAISGASATSAQIDAWKAAVSTARASVNTAISTLTAAVGARKNVASTLERDKKTLALQEAGSTSSTIAAQQAQVSGAQANVSALSAQIAQMRITAPVSGIVTAVNVEAGETVAPSVVAISMIPDAKLQIDVNLSEDNVANAKVGDLARITLDAFGAATLWQGIVTKIDPAQTVIGGAVYYKTTVNFNTPDDRVKPGMTANVWIQTGTASSTLVVPASALQNDSFGMYVQIVDGTTVKKQSVTTGLKSQDGKVQIVSGLKGGELVVTGQ